MMTLIDSGVRDFQLEPVNKGLNVALTGSTGSLGSRILKGLVKDPRVSKIYCLDRSSNSRKIAGSIIENAGADVRHLQANLEDPHFGLPVETYDLIRYITTMLILPHIQSISTFIYRLSSRLYGLLRI